MPLRPNAIKARRAKGIAKGAMARPRGEPQELPPQGKNESRQGKDEHKHADKHREGVSHAFGMGVDCREEGYDQRQCPHRSREAA